MAYKGEICADCGGVVNLGVAGVWVHWVASNELWEKVMRTRKPVLCMGCFAMRAAALGISIHFEAVEGT